MEIEQFKEQLSSATKTLQTFGNNANKMNSIDTGLAAAVQKSNDAESNKIEKLKKLDNIVSKAANDITGFLKNLTTSGSSFSPLASAVTATTDAIGGIMGLLMGPVGMLLGGALKAAGTLAAESIKAHEKAYGVFQKLSDTGLVTSYTDMQQSAAILELNQDDLSKVLSKNSKELAIFGGSTISGRKQLELLANDTRDNRKYLLDSGFAMDEINDFQVSFLAQQNRMSLGKYKMNDQTSASWKEYASNLDAMSKMLGVSRRELDKANLDITKSYFYQLELAEKSAKSVQGPEQLKIFLNTVSGAFTPEFTKIVTEVLVRKDAARSDEAQALANIIRKTGKSVEEWVNEVLNVNTGMDSAGKFIEMMANASAEEKRLATIVGSNNLQTRLIEERIKAQNIRGIYTQEELDKRKAEQASKDGKKKDVDPITKTYENMNKSSRQLQELMSNSKIVATAMDYMSTGLELATEKIYDVAGDALPPHLQAKKDARLAKVAHESAIKVASSVSADESLIDNAKRNYSNLPLKDAVGATLTRAYLGKEQTTQLAYADVGRAQTNRATTQLNAINEGEKSGTLSPVQAVQQRSSLYDMMDPSGGGWVKPVTDITKNRTGSILSDPFDNSDSSSNDVRDGSEIGQRSLNTQAVLGTANKNPKFEKIYFEMSEKMAQLVSLLEENVREQKKHLQAQMS